MLTDKTNSMDDRTKYVGASEVGRLMSGNPEQVHEMWMIKTGRKSEPDLSKPEDCDNWFQVRLGIHTEELNIEARSELEPDMDVKFHNKSHVHRSFKMIRARPDALCLHNNEHAVMDAKHTHPFNGTFDNKEDRVRGSYYWQMQQQMLCTGWDHAYLSPIYGNTLGGLIYIEANKFDQGLIEDTILDFWEKVVSNQEPSVPKAIIHTVPSEYRKIKFEETNFGAEVEALAETWATNKPAAALLKDTDAAIKKLIPDDVNIAEGYGIKVTRTKPSKTRPNGSLSIKEA